MSLHSHQRPYGDLICIVLAGAVLAIRIWIAARLPIEIRPHATHDEAAFMSAAVHLANGDWLGTYDPFTLMKGPGYPAFLALVHMSGLPVTLGHALLHAIAFAMAGWAVARLGGSRWLGTLTVMLLAFLPNGMLPEMQLVIRDQIYWAQGIMVFSLFAVLLLAAPSPPWRMLLLAALAGLVLGWTWLTREETIWLVPGLAVMAAAGFIASTQDRTVRSRLVLGMAIAGAAFSIPHLVFMTGNKIAYGKFIGVDFKERNFASALDALQDVGAGPIVPYVPVPRAVREVVASVSPEFARLNESLESLDAAIRLKGPGCRVYPHSCGDYAGGWFMWALRAAAEHEGYYESPEIASRRFGELADEIGAACSDGRLTCRTRWISYVPWMTRNQWFGLPVNITRTAGKVAFLSGARKYDAPASLDAAAMPAFNRYWTFLNRPDVKPLPQTNRRLTARGWYHERSNPVWPAFAVVDHGGNALSFDFERLPSPDIAEAFDDPVATNQRFTMAFNCPEECMIAAGSLKVVLTGRGPLSASGDGATLYVDRVKNFAVGPASAFRAILIDVYSLLLPILLVAGLVAFLVGVVREGIRRRFGSELVLAAALWTAVSARIAILSLIDASSFPGATFLYAAPATYLAAIAAILSTWALCQRPETAAGLRAPAATSIPPNSAPGAREFP
jgi:hypothetical protein